MKKTGTPASAARKSTRRKHAHIAKIALHFGLATLTAPMMVQANEVIAPATEGTAKANSRNYSIARQPLYSALSALAEQAGIQFVYDAEMVKNLTSPGVQGQYTADAALQKVLSGTGISFRHTGPNTVALEHNKSVKEPDATTLKSMTVSAKRDAEPQGYSVSNASTATKTDTPIMETPMSIQVISKAVMEDQQVITLEDAVKNVSGVQRSWGYGSLYDNFYLRGFSTSQVGNYRNGFRMADYAAETANVESIDVLKGPASMLYGRTDPGGIINVATKKPLDHAYYSLQQQFGSYDLYRTTADATGPITNDKSLLYRFNLAYTEANSFRDYVYTDRIFIAPSLTWRPTDATEVNLNFEYKKDIFPIDNGIPTLHGQNRPAQVPISRVYHEPESNTRVEDYLVDLNWSHRINDFWKVKNSFVAKTQDYFLEAIPGPSLQADNRTINRFANFTDTVRQSYGAFLDLTGHFETFGVQHDVLAGTDWYQHEREAIGSFRPTTTIDVFSPVYGTVDFNQHRWFRDHAPNSFYSATDQWFGVYFQDQITLWDKLHILGGGRHDWARGQSGSSATSMAAINQAIVDTERFQPRVGIVYEAWNWLSLYGNYTESLGNNNGITASGAAMEPETAEQFETGIKTEWFDGRLNSTLAYYHIEKQNLRTPDISTVNQFDQIAIGKARSQGIELDVKGQVTDNLSIIGTYALTDARITKSNNGDEGNRLPNVPENSGSLWAKYDFNGTPLDGFSLGSGIYVAGQREGDNANTLQLPGYARWDAMAAYRFKVGKSRLTAQLNVNNILNKQYYKVTDVMDGNPRQRVLPAEPLTLMGSVRLEF